MTIAILIIIESTTVLSDRGDTWCYLAWGHFQLPADPASKLTEQIVQ